jgi:site-specific recombinase XerD
MFNTQLNTWKHHLADQQASPALAQPFTDAVSVFLAFLQEQGSIAPARVTPALVATWRKRLQASGTESGPGGLVPSEQFFAVRCFLRYLERAGDIPDDPAADLAPLPVPARETTKELTALEAQALLLAPDLATDHRSALGRALGWRDRAALDLLYRTGITPRRLLALPVSAIPLDDLYIPDRPPATARVELACDPHGWVESWIRVARPRLVTATSPDALFLDPDGTALDAAGLSALVSNAARQAGLPKRVSPRTVMQSGVALRLSRLSRPTACLPQTP